MPESSAADPYLREQEEALAGKRPGMVDDDRLVAARSHLYGLALENPT